MSREWAIWPIRGRCDEDLSSRAGQHLRRVKSAATIPERCHHPERGDQAERRKVEANDEDGPGPDAETYRDRTKVQRGSAAL